MVDLLSQNCEIQSQNFGLQSEYLELLCHNFDLLFKPLTKYVEILSYHEYLVFFLLLRT